MEWIAPPEKDAANDALEKHLWATADQLRANSGLNAQQYSQPVLGLIFLRFAEVRFAFRRAALEKQAAGGRRGSRLDESASAERQSPPHSRPAAVPPSVRKIFREFQDGELSPMITPLRHPVVVIMGAGATRGGLAGKSSLPPPLDADFFDIAGQLRGHGTQRLASRVLESVWQLYGRTSGISLERYYRDIETRAAILRFAKTANQPKNWARRQSDLDELVRRVFIHTTCDSSTNPLTPKPSECHSKILKHLRGGDTVVTFNYDLVIEESFPAGSKWSPIDGYGSGVQGKRFPWCRRWLERVQPPEKSSLQLLKLHGSLNWTLYRDGTIRLKPFPYVVRTKNGRPAFDKISILPPGWNKRIDKKPYRGFWREARLRLEQCRTLVVIGYSLPETDLLAQALLAEVVRVRQARGKRKHLKQLHLVDPAVAVKERFINLFTPALGPGGTISKYQDIREFSEAL